MFQENVENFKCFPKNTFFIEKDKIRKTAISVLENKGKLMHYY